MKSSFSVQMNVCEVDFSSMHPFKVPVHKFSFAAQTASCSSLTTVIIQGC